MYKKQKKQIKIPRQDILNLLSDKTITIDDITISCVKKKKLIDYEIIRIP